MDHQGVSQPVARSLQAVPMAPPTRMFFPHSSPHRRDGPPCRASRRRARGSRSERRGGRRRRPAAGVRRGSRAIRRYQELKSGIVLLVRRRVVAMAQREHRRVIAGLWHGRRRDRRAPRHECLARSRKMILRGGKRCACRTGKPSCATARIRASRSVKCDRRAAALTGLAVPHRPGVKPRCPRRWPAKFTVALTPSAARSYRNDISASCRWAVPGPLRYVARVLSIVLPSVPCFSP